jgi:ArsR family transcriptional regulator
MAKTIAAEVQTTEPCCAPVMTAPLDPDHAVDMAKMFKALGDPVRLRILSLIASSQEECCVCDLSSSFDLSAPTISYHLKVLREADLVESDRRGTWVYYRPRAENLGRLSAILAVPGVPAVMGCS